MFINISSDQIHIIHWNTNYQIQSTNIHKILPVELVKIFKSNHFEKVFLVNGPWSFTNLRSWCLSLNLLSIFFSSLLEKYSVSKIDLYLYFYKLWFIPRYGLIYIWQKKKVWLYDFNKCTFEYFEIEKMKDLKQDYFCDQVFWDFKSIFPKDNLVELNIEGNNIVLSYWQSNYTEKLDSIFNSQVSFFVPNYMIQPNIY